MAQGRHPIVIWLRRTRKNRYWAHKRRLARAGARIPWSSAGLYGMALLLAALVLWKVPARSSIITVSTQPQVTSRPSWMDRLVASWNVPESTLRSWLDQGVPLAGLVLSRHRVQAHLGELMAMGVRALTGVHYADLHALLQVEIPALGVVKPLNVRPVKKRVVPARPKAQNAVDPNLPGDGGRVWAVLGADPIVGIYQTHSTESFWPYVPAGSATADSSDWSKTIVQVGWWFAQDLHLIGISVVQSRVNNMSQGLLASYNKSYYTAKTLLKWYPSVRILIDLHRAPSNRTPATIAGKSVAKISFVVGTDKLLPNPYWHQNLAFAEKLSRRLNAIAPGILEGSGIDVVPYRYNEQLMPGDLMIEVGGPNSTLAEESNAVYELARAIQGLVTNGEIP